MKKALLSIAISFVLVFVYNSVLVYFEVRSNWETNWETNWKTPVSVPQNIYSYLFPPPLKIPPPSPTKMLVLTVVFFLANVFLYSIPIFGLVTLFSKHKKGKVPALNAAPPPAFDD